MATLKKGSTGKEVKGLQNWLNWQGFTDDNGNKLVEDGSFGDLTKQAVKKFQRAVGIKDDGIYGPISQRAAYNWGKAHPNGKQSTKPGSSSGNTVAPVSSNKLLVYPTSPFHTDSLAYGTIWPQNTKKIHCGVDVNRDEAGIPVKSIKSGIVKHVNVTHEWDTVVCIEHTATTGNKYTSVYWHIEQVSVAEGQTVSTGQGIGVIGRNNGVHQYHDHLHFGIRYAPYDGNMSLKGALDKGNFPERFIDPVAFLRKYAR